MDALARLIGWKLSLHGVPTEGQVVVTSRGGSANRYPSGTPVTLERICGHRDGDSTVVPRRRRSTPSCPTCAPAPRATRARWPGITVRAATPRIRTRPVAALGRAALPRRLLARRRAARDPVRGAGRGVRPHRRHRLRPRRHAGPRSCRSPSSGSLRAAFLGDAHAAAARLLPHRDPRAADCCGCASPRAALRARPQRRRLGHGVAEADARGRVEVRLERRVGRRWRRVQRKRINVRGGRYLTKVRMRTRGPLPRVRAHAGRHAAPAAARPLAR